MMTGEKCTVYSDQLPPTTNIYDRMLCTDYSLFFRCELQLSLEDGYNKQTRYMTNDFFIDRS